LNFAKFDIKRDHFVASGSSADGMCCLRISV